MARSSGAPASPIHRADAPRAPWRHRAIHALTTLAVSGTLALGSAALSGCGNSGYYGSPVRPVERAPEISAEDTGGGAFHLQDLRGRIVVLSFGYTSCPDVCPTTLSRMKDIYRRLGEARGADVAMVFLTIDPERDSVARLRDYVSAFDPRILGLRLTGAPLSSTLLAYGVKSERHELPADRYEGRPLEGSYHSFDHTSGYFVIDRAGFLRLRFSADAPADEMTSDILALTADGAPR